MPEWLEPRAMLTAISSTVFGNVIAGDAQSSRSPAAAELVTSASAGSGFSSEVNVASATATIQGMIFGDANQNGVFEPLLDEKPIAGQTVYLDLNGNGRLDSPNEPSRITDAAGEYSFDQLAPGHYSVAQAPTYGLQQNAPARPSPSVRLIDLAANDIVADPIGGRIYASTSDGAGPLSNSIVQIDPIMGTVVNSLSLGSGGGKLAISDDGQFLYVAMDGAVQQVNLSAMTLGVKFSIAPLQVDDMAVMPGHPHTLAVERYTPGFSPRDAKIAIYDDGVQRPLTAGGGNVIAFGSDSVLYGYINETTAFQFNRMVVTADGISGGAQSGDLIYGFGTDIEYDNGRIYTTSGGILDPTSLVEVGAFQAGGSVEPISSRGLTVFLNGNTLKAFDQQTFLPVGSFTVPGVSDTSYGLIHWGADGIAFRTTTNQIGLVEWNPRLATHDIDVIAGETLTGQDFGDHSPTQPGTIRGQVYHDANGDGSPGAGEPGIAGWTLFLDQNGNGQLDASERTTQTDALGNYSFDEVPAGDYVVTELPQTGWQQTAPVPQQGQVREIDVIANDIVYSPVTQKVYASIGSNVDVIGNSVAVIDPVSGSIDSTIFVGSEPNKLAVSDDGQFLYAALDGAKSVVRVDLKSLAVDSQFSVNPYLIGDIEVPPGEPHSVAVTRFDPRFSPSGAGAAIYDDGVRRLRTAASSAIEFSSSASVMYGIDNEFSAHTFYRLAAQSDGLNATSATDNLISGDIQFAGGRIYATDGNVIDPETRAVLGRMGSGSVDPVSSRGLTYFLSGGLLSAYDQQTFNQVGRYSLPGITQSNGLIDWGTQGLAFRGATGQIVLVEWDPRNPLSSRTQPVHLAANQTIAGLDFGNLNTAVINPPVGVPDSYSAFEDLPLAVPAPGVLKNDTDPDSPVITTVLVSGPAHGTVSLNLDGSFTYTPSRNFNGADSFTYRANDNQGLSAVTTVSLSIAPTNDPPSGTNRTITTREDTTHTFVAADFPFTDSLDKPANGLLAIWIASLPAAGSLTNNGAGVSVGDFVSAANFSGGLFQFAPPADASGSALARFKFQIQDDGGTANGGVDLDQTANTMTMNVTAVNDSPSGGDATISVPEDTGYTFQTSDFGFSDAHDNPANVLLAIEITTLPAAGSLSNRGQSVAAGQMIAAGDVATGQLRYVPPANAHGSPLTSFTFQVKDNGGNLNGGADLDPTPNAMVIQVTSVNDPPIGADLAITRLENSPHTFALGEFGFRDPFDLPANSLQAVKIVALPAVGTLTDHGLPVFANQFIPAADVASGLLVFTSGTGDSGSGVATIEFQLQDDGGTANGGVDLDPILHTVKISVTPIDVAPVVTLNGNTTIGEGASVVLIGSFVDPDVDDSWTATVDYGDGSGPHALSLNPDKSFQVVHRYVDDGNFTATVSVEDEGHRVGSATGRVLVNNVPPQNLTLTWPPFAVQGRSLSFSGSFTDPGIVDTHGATIDWDDGSSSSATVSGSGTSHSVRASHTYATGGIYHVLLTVTDDDGGIATLANVVLVGGARIVQGTMEIVGTSGNDTFALDQSRGRLRLSATIGFVHYSQSFIPQGVTQIVASLGDGNDALSISTSVTVPALIDGGAGNDSLSDRGGSAVIVGGDGNDVLAAGNRRSVLIGGTGADRLVGGNGSDLLIAGSTVYDQNDPALWALQAEWNSARPLSQRMANLSSGSGPIVGPLSVRLVTNQTVFDDASVDILFGGGDVDWYFGNPKKDKFSGRVSRETIA